MQPEGQLTRAASARRRAAPAEARSRPSLTLTSADVRANQNQ
ncbi:hypothetical protein ACFPRL_22720 [Pseudoclavibacter helvolus]